MQAGQTIHARYRIEAVLGAGGMGTTYKAMDLQTSRPVAVKVLHLSRAQEWTTLEMFAQEAKLLQQLTHPNIPRYVEYFTIDSPRDQQFVLVQEYIDGETLQHKVEAGWQLPQKTFVILPFNWWIFSNIFMVSIPRWFTAM